MSQATSARSSSLDPTLDQAGLTEATAADLLAVARLLDANPFLCRGLSQPATPLAQRQELARGLFSGKIDQAALDILLAAVALPWGDAAGLVRGLERQGIRAIWLGTERDQLSGQVIDELFQFGQLVTGHHELRRQLTDFTVEPGRRQQLVRQLLAGKARPETATLAEQAITTHTSTFEEAIQRQLALADQIRGSQVATVTVARALDATQSARLAAALSAKISRRVIIEQIVDRGVLGGIRIDLGGEIIDSTLTARLDQARRQMT